MATNKIRGSASAADVLKDLGIDTDGAPASEGSFEDSSTENVSVVPVAPAVEPSPANEVQTIGLDDGMARSLAQGLPQEPPVMVNDGNTLETTIEGPGEITLARAGAPLASELHAPLNPEPQVIELKPGDPAWPDLLQRGEHSSVSLSEVQRGFLLDALTFYTIAMNAHGQRARFEAEHPQGMNPDTIGAQRRLAAISRDIARAEDLIQLFKGSN